jgi:hypothetical protein
VTATLHAYMAGIIDADGTIGVKRRTEGGLIRYSECVCVRQVEPEAVDLLHEHFGGYRFVTRPTMPNRRELQGWEVTNRRAAECLAVLEPYLRIKVEQARVCLILSRTKIASTARIRAGRPGMITSTPESREEMAVCYSRCRELNRAGVVA